MTEMPEKSAISHHQNVVKRKKYGGKYPKITPELIGRIANRRAQGISVRRALSLETPPIPLSHWQKSLEHAPRLSLVFEQKETEALLPVIEEMLSAKPGQWQKLAWILERSFPSEYSTRAGNGIQIHNTINTLVGLSDEIAKRARAFVGCSQGSTKRISSRDLGANALTLPAAE